MIPIRHSNDTRQNPRLRPQPRRRGETNGAWLARTGMSAGVLLIGGTGVVDFRVRVAQSHLRNDLVPSHWSQAGLLLGQRGGRFLSVPLGAHRDPSAVPGRNAIEECRMRDYDDPDRYPNLAVLDFGGQARSATKNADAIAAQRSVVDLVSLLVAWLAFVWGAGRQGNPLLDGNGVPSAALVEAAYGIDRIELTPGLSSQASCPEAIWQSAKWWSGYYKRAAAEPTRNAAVPAGRFVIDQPEAAVRAARRRR